MKYAENTKVSCGVSQAEIKTLLNRYGASRFATMDEPGRSAIMFEVHGRRVRFVLPLPSLADVPDKDGRKSLRTPDQKYVIWEQMCRQKWRALCLAIKAKLEVVESQIATFEEEFLSYVVLPDSKTVGEFMVPQLDTVYKNGQMPLLLPGLGETSNVVDGTFGKR